MKERLNIMQDEHHRSFWEFSCESDGKQYYGKSEDVLQAILKSGYVSTIEEAINLSNKLGYDFTHSPK